ncbi:mechanosensitive ion channel [Maribius pontilimi]|uniref:Mechanosensitive ion channel n=1 Tax=Palleronia pontilimi TaxID=1964209 RepID=A0A934IIE2_9RHOB|nr:mechanosensitive ion channel domain-containing protein [Palleronia pontilimi]MBJ3763483.1 mechanosensitive ion channel [Palleronia pontilimi]
MGHFNLRILAAILAVCLSGPLTAQSTDTDGPVGTYFTVETLNPGLPPRPDYVDLRTPQGAAETFLDLAELGDPAMAHALDLSAFDPVDQPVLGPRLAEQLNLILKQQAVLSWRLLLERPDALNAVQSSNVAMAGEPRRSILIGVLDDGDREAAIRLNRVRPEGGDPVWVFSQRTVSQIPDLYAAYGPSDLERNLPGWLRAETILGLKVWELVGLPIIAALAWISGYVTWHAFRRMSHEQQGYWERVTLRAVRWPITIAVVTTVVLVAALKVFTVSGLVASILTPLTLIGYTGAVLLFALSVIDTALDRIVTFDSEKLADPDNSTIRNLATLMTAGRRVAIVVALLIGTGIVLASANVFRSLGFSLLASAGAITLILGFAARTVLGNILASLQIAINRSARIGDQLQFDGTFCTVERIHFTFVQLKTWNGQRKVVPVSYFVSKEFENYSMVDGGSVRFSLLTLAQEADVDALRQRFMDITERDDRVQPKDECRVIVTGQDAFGKQVRFEAPIPNQGDAWQAECDIREAILKAAREIEDETGAPMLPKGAVDEMAA